MGALSRWVSTTLPLICLLLLCATPGPAAAAEPVLLSHFELQSSNGFTLEGGELREGDFSPTVALSVSRARSGASYETPGEPGPATRASFGALGGVDLSFERRKRSVERPERGCVWVSEKGTFHGNLSFRGEGGYTEVEATAIGGEVLRLPRGLCGFPARSSAVAPAPGWTVSRLVARARTRHGSAEVEAVELGKPAGVSILARTQERLGALQVSRYAAGEDADASLGLDSGLARRHLTVRPRTPFQGSASFHRQRRGPSTWRGSLRVSLPGAPRTALAGPAFSVRLCAGQGLFDVCRLRLPPRRRDGGHPVQGSGSHSQALAEVRLSMSRYAFNWASSSGSIP